MSDPTRPAGPFGNRLAEELKTMVGDSLQSSADAFIRGLGLVKTAAIRSPDRKVGPLDMAKRWARINLETSRIVSRHTQAAVREILDAYERYGLLDGDAGSDAEPEAGDAAGRSPQEDVIIQLNGAVGQTATGLFVVSNPGVRKMAATFSTSEFVNEGGHAVPDAAVSFSPDRLELSPGQEATIAVSIGVSPDFRAGTAYRATIRIPEYPGKQIHLLLRVAPETAAETGGGEEG
jgi:hypothetical protein